MKNGVRTCGTHCGAEVKFPSVIRVYGSNKEFDAKVNYHGRKFGYIGIHKVVRGSTEEKYRGEPRSRYASSMPGK